jgi:methionyl aminopeptidase
MSCSSITMLRWHFALPLAACSWRSSRTTHRLWNYSRYFSKSSTHRQQSAGDDFAFGDYSVILPNEPYILGVSHIVPRSVPPNIVRPHYALLGYSDDYSTEKGDGHGKIVLGGEAEFRLREAAKLAKKVREYAGKLVQVRQSCKSV